MKLKNIMIGAGSVAIIAACSNTKTEIPNVVGAVFGDAPGSICLQYDVVKDPENTADYMECRYFKATPKGIYFSMPYKTCTAGKDENGYFDEDTECTYRDIRPKDQIDFYPYEREML